MGDGWVMGGSGVGQYSIVKGRSVKYLNNERRNSVGEEHVTDIYTE